MDYVGAFLQAPVRGRIFVHLHQEFNKIYPEFKEYYGKPLRLIKSAYGMILSSKNWFVEFQGYLTSNVGRFKRSEVDNTLFVRTEKDGSLTKMLVYINDSLYFNTRNNKKLIEQLETEIKTRFKIELQGHAYWFLLMQISRDKYSNYTLDQSRCMKNLVRKHLGDTKTRSIKRALPETWIATNKDIAKDLNEVTKLSEEYQIDYPSAVGSLIYLLTTRPDITFAVTKLAKLMQMPGRGHLKALIHLLDYLRDNLEYRIKFYKNVEDSPIHELLVRNKKSVEHGFFGICDSSWQDCPVTGRSTGSYIIFSQGGPVDFSSYVPVPVAMSSAEAECNVGATAGMALSHLRMLIKELNGRDADEIWQPPIMLFSDSQSGVAIVNTERDVKSLRHCKRRLFYLRQMTKENEIKMEFITNEDMVADGGMKNLDATEIEKINKYMMVKVTA